MMPIGWLTPALAIALALRAMGSPAQSGTPAPGGWRTPWSYEGARGPEHWGELDPDYAACSAGRQQSPHRHRTHDGGRRAGHPLRLQERTDANHQQRIYGSPRQLSARERAFPDRRRCALRADAVPSSSSSERRGRARQAVRDGGAPDARVEGREGRGGDGAAESRDGERNGAAALGPCA